MMEKNICENCKHYFMIDSGYGKCRRFPPAWEQQKEYWWQRLKNHLTYLIVQWDTKSCGEYTSDEQN